MIEKLGKSEREKNTRQVASVAAYRDGKILMGLRGDVKLWCLPGGHLEPDESPAKGAVRELLEETGLKAKSLERLGSAIVGKNKNVQVHSYRADVEGSPDASGDPDAEMVEFRWVDPEDIPAEILANLYNKQDVTLQLIGAQPKTIDLSKASLAEIMAHTKVVADHMRALANSGATSHIFPHPNGGSVVVAKDPSKPGKYRATRITALGEPLGHVEADDIHGAIKHAHSYGAHVLAVQPFKKHIEEWLGKAQRSSDFRTIVKATTPEGPRFVDHKTQLNAHPLSLSPEIEHYQNEVVKGPSVFVPKRGKTSEGVSRKVIYQTQARPQGDMFAPSPHGMEASFMVKPYHEGIVKRVASWQKYPIQGWAEMAHQALYHAGGIGDLHQKVHVAEHEMEDERGHKSTEPALVVHMEKGLTPAYQMRNGQYENKPILDTAKIATMDFLTNNLDRHGGNLMFGTVPKAAEPVNPNEPEWMREEKSRYGVQRVNRVLAIDHSRSFQYVNTHDSKWDSQAKVKRQNKAMTDSMRSYFFGSATGRPATSLVLPRPRTYEEQHNFLEHVAKPTFDWWEQHGPRIKAAFDEQVQHIKDPEARSHISRNFHERAKFLDERARMGIENYGTDWYDDSVNQYRPDQKTDEEIEEAKAAEDRERFAREDAERKARVA